MKAREVVPLRTIGRAIKLDNNTPVQSDNDCDQEHFVLPPSLRPNKKIYQKLNKSHRTASFHNDTNYSKSKAPPASIEKDQTSFLFGDDSPPSRNMFKEWL